jgi:hypothetical protein
MEKLNLVILLGLTALGTTLMLGPGHEPDAGIGFRI